MVECQEGCLDQCQRQRIHNLVCVPMFQIGDVSECRIDHISYGMCSVVKVSMISFLRSGEEQYVLTQLHS